MLDTIVELVAQFQILLAIQIQLEIFVNLDTIVHLAHLNQQSALQELMNQEKDLQNVKTAQQAIIVRKVQLSQ